MESSLRLHHVFESCNGSSDGRIVQREQLSRVSPAIPRGISEPRSIIPVNPEPLLLSEGNARIDVAVEGATGRRRHALAIAGVGAVTGDADAAALEAIGIV